MSDAERKSSFVDGRTVLCVDDDRNILAALARVLHPLGVHVYTAGCCHTALTIALEEPPDLIFLDLFMPEVDGYGCLHLLREAGVQVPVVMLTADTDVMRGYGEGAAFFLCKPFDNEHIRNLVEYLIGDPSPERREWLECHL